MKSTTCAGPTPARLLDTGLDEVLDRLQARIRSLSDQLAARYFRKPQLVRVV